MAAKRVLEPIIRDTMKQRLLAEKAAEAVKPAEQRRDYRTLQQELYHAVLAEHGVRVSSDGWVADVAENIAEGDVNKAEGEVSEQDGGDAAAEQSRLLAQRGRYIFENDAAAQEIDLPQKWRRLRVHLDSLLLDLSNAETLQDQVAEWTRRMRVAVNETVAAWLATDDGRGFAYRPATIRPSHFRSEEAWLLLNKTFAAAGAERGIEDWRLFQLTFVLAHIPTLASRMSEYARSPWFDPAFDEETATLLYFPTGGGKSEAFFGLLIFNLFLDRLRGKNTGITALIRYPLRLLTLQQTQRLLAILMRADLLRRDAGLGGQPFEIGFWVGSGNTPNKPEDPRLKPVPQLNDPNHAEDSRLRRGVHRGQPELQQDADVPFVQTRDRPAACKQRHRGRNQYCLFQ